MRQAINHTNKRSDTLLLWLWRRYIHRQLPRLIAATLLMSVQGAMLGVLSYLIRPVFDEIFAKQNHDALLTVGFAVMLVFTVRGLAGFSQRVLMAAVGERLKFDLQQDLVSRVMTLDKQFFEDNPPGDLIQRVNNDVMAVKGIWQGLLAPGVRDLISIIALFTVAVSIDWTWTLIAVAGIPLLSVPVVVLQKVTRRYAKGAAEGAAGIIVRLEEMFHNIREIKLYRAESSQEQRFTSFANTVKRANVRTEASIAGVPALVDVVAGIGFFGLLLIAGRDVIDGERTIGEFMSFFTACVLLFDPAKRLGNLMAGWQQAKVLLERATAIFDASPTVIDPDKPASLPDYVEHLSVEFENVYLDYGGASVIKDLSFTAEAGKVTALVGPSGVGKTSIFNLIARIRESSGGTIRVGGQDIRQLSVDQLRDKMAVVAQDSGIFDESIRENIMLGNTVAGDEDFQRAAAAARVTDFIGEEGKGFDESCGPRGALLSGGQKQRVAIARALLRNAPILLLDEPTSALDLETEKLVQDAILTLAKDRTVIIIAHRLSTIQSADKICVIENGRVKEQGDHEQLIAKKGLYATLYQMQFKEEEDHGEDTEVPPERAAGSA
ncbi:MAG: ABC transporter ATP-binding protein [Rhodobacteraceae bacterium]|nr:ABC transporter ATP-binding protein [Paracoccaceae bacterium]